MTVAPVLTGRQMGLAVCRSCYRVTDRPGAPCEDCGAVVHLRAPRSLQAVWAWWSAGVVLYIPGNIFPIMETRYLGTEYSSTIIGGVVALFHHGSYLIGAVVLIASVLVPVAKFVTIAIIALSIQRRWRISSHRRHQAHALIEYIGRWSMVDVFVVAALAALIRLGGVVEIGAGSGVAFFALSVALTMLSAQALDPRLIWDDDWPESDDV